MKNKKSLLDLVPVSLVNKAEWENYQDSLEIRLFDGKNISAKLIIMKGSNPVINFYEADGNGKLKISKKFLFAGKNDGIVSSITLSELKKSTIPMEQKAKRPYNRRASVPGTEVPATNVSAPVTKGSKRGPKPKAVTAESLKSVKVVKTNVVKNKVNTPNGLWTKKENFLKIEPLNVKELKLTLEQFVEKYIPIQSQQNVLAILTNILVRYGKVSNTPTLQDVIALINDVNVLKDGLKELLQTSNNANGLIPIAYYSALKHLFSNLMQKQGVYGTNYRSGLRGIISSH